ncbi:MULTISPECIES: PqqD family protein [Sphingomonas]|uniref:PqqD family protein n=1 Tax=Sphingomonas TaxID=13687 RepID=UPI0013B3CB9F|nr:MULTISPECIES: PqqD family protein [Sphingomonas]
MSADNPTFVRARDLLEAELGDELVALDARDGLCFGFNDVATAIWRQLATPTALSDLVDHLVADYDVTPTQCREDVSAALEIMAEHRLIRTI